MTRAPEAMRPAARPWRSSSISSGLRLRSEVMSPGLLNDEAGEIDLGDAAEPRLGFKRLVDRAAQAALQRFLAGNGCDLIGGLFGKHAKHGGTDRRLVLLHRLGHLGIKIGRASLRASVCQYV